MFKKILLASVLLVLVAPASSVKALDYWDLQGSNIHNVNSGFVGIGTINPVSKLDVRGGDMSLGNNQAYRIFDPAGTARVMFMLDNLGNQIVGASTMSTGGDMQLRVPSFATGAVTIKASSGNVGIGTATPQAKLDVAGSANVSGNVGIGFVPPNYIPKLYVDGLIGSRCSAFDVETQPISAIGWYSITTSFSSCSSIDPDKVRIGLTQNNSGTGDISIISLRVKKNSITSNSFQIEYYVNAVPTAGTTKFNVFAMQGIF